MLTIENLHARVEGKKILNGINCPIIKRVFINAGSEPISEYNPYKNIEAKGLVTLQQRNFSNTLS